VVGGNASSLNMYNRLTERCFRECVDSFRRKAMDSTEERVGLPCPAPCSSQLLPTDGTT
jgi:hypothetical protein